MSVSELSVSTQNYLKVIWGLEEWSSTPVTATEIAQKTGLRMSSVSDAVRKMAGQGLVDHQRYGAVELTEAGRAYAVQMVRRHRLLETFLVSVLGYDWEKIHDEAEHLEHAVSDFFVERLDSILGHPDRDPHGDPIPDAHGVVDVPSAQPLTEMKPGARVTVERISDEDAELLGFFSERGITPGAVLRLGTPEPFSDAMAVLVEGSDAPVSLGARAGNSLFVAALDD